MAPFTSSIHLEGMASTQFSLVLASHHPSQLVVFYAELLTGEAKQGLSENHWILSVSNDLRIEFYRPSSKRPFPEKGRCLAPCLKLQGQHDPLNHLHSVVADLRSKNATVLEPPRSEPFGAEAWLLDPEDNPFLVVVPSSITTPEGHGQRPA